MVYSLTRHFQVSLDSFERYASIERSFRFQRINFPHPSLRWGLWIPWQYSHALLIPQRPCSQYQSRPVLCNAFNDLHNSDDIILLFVSWESLLYTAHGHSLHPDGDRTNRCISTWNVNFVPLYAVRENPLLSLKFETTATTWTFPSHCIRNVCCNFLYSRGDDDQVSGHQGGDPWGHHSFLLSLFWGLHRYFYTFDLHGVWIRFMGLQLDPFSMGLRGWITDNDWVGSPELCIVCWNCRHHFFNCKLLSRHTNSYRASHSWPNDIFRAANRCLFMRSRGLLCGIEFISMGIDLML